MRTRLLARRERGSMEVGMDSGIGSDILDADVVLGIMAERDEVYLGRR